MVQENWNMFYPDYKEGNIHSNTIQAKEITENSSVLKKNLKENFLRFVWMAF